ncbi:MAG: GNAT family N-acetyltransferase [Gammaproteobacteria bacterium]|nr:GNAT family N-acetyltransferase [Gammaproteobacteria bacterium]
MQQLKIRTATANDSAEISALISRNTKMLLNDDFDEDGLEFFLRSVETQSIREYMDQGFFYLVAQEAKRIVGVIAIKDNRHMFHLFVDQNHHKCGIAKMLWEQMKAHSLEQGNDGTFTLNSTTYALPIYQRWGFEVISEAKHAYGIRYTPMKLVVKQVQLETVDGQNN